MQGRFDESWRAKALQGDPLALQLLADECLKPLFGFCYYRVGRNRHVCEEITQETLVRAIVDLEKYQPERAGGNIFPWLTGLARNEIQRVFHRQKSTVSLDTLWERVDQELLDVYSKIENESFSEELLQRDETRDMVNATMSQLPPHYREALEAKYVVGKSVQEISETLAVSPKAAESLLTRAREAFRVTFVALARNLSIEAL